MSKKISYSEIADLIFGEVENQLANGAVPWHKPFVDGAPMSLGSGKAYQGWNWLWLTMVQSSRGYKSNYWTTYANARKMGGYVRKGERATDVFYINFNASRKVENSAGEIEVKRFPIFRAFSVFNLDQCEDIKAPNADRAPVEPVTATDAIMADYLNRPNIYNSPEGRAYYSPMLDSIHMPNLENFDSGADYFRTLAHEMTHSTGHASRLDRFKDASMYFGCETYAQEELVAELGASMLSGHYGVDIEVKNSGAYIVNWLGALRNDKAMLLPALTKAKNAVARITGVTAEDKAEDKEEVSA